MSSKMKLKIATASKISYNSSVVNYGDFSAVTAKVTVLLWDICRPTRTKEWSCGVGKSIRWYEENLLEDDEATAADDENDDDDDLTGESEGSERVDGEASATLWPTAGVRMRWLEALQRSKTVSEVAMALSTFMDHSRAFGIMDDSDSAEGRSSKSESKGGRRAAPAPGPSPYKRKGKSSVSDTHNEGGRARRAAARTVLSYAE
jgi:hypothetical protein